MIQSKNAASNGLTQIDGGIEISSRSGMNADDRHTHLTDAGREKGSMG